MSCSHLHAPLRRLVSRVTPSGKVTGYLMQCCECGDVQRVQVTEDMGEMPIVGLGVTLYPIPHDGGARADSVMAATMAGEVADCTSVPEPEQNLNASLLEA
jgi:hypothetical protein